MLQTFSMDKLEHNASSHITLRRSKAYLKKKKMTNGRDYSNHRFSSIAHKQGWTEITLGFQQHEISAPSRYFKTIVA